MDCQPISVNTNFKAKPHSKKYYDPWKLYRIQREAVEKQRREIIEENGFRDYATGFSSIIDGFMDIIDGLVSIFKSFGPEPYSPKIKRSVSPHSKFAGKSAEQRYAEGMKRDHDAIADAWKKVGDTLGFIMGGK